MTPSLTHLLDRIFYFVQFLPFAVLPFLLFSWIKYIRGRHPGATPRRFPAISVGLFIGSILLIFATTDAIEMGARGEARTFLHNVDDPVVAINGNIVTNFEPILNALHSTASVPAHHSHPTAIIHVTITDKTGFLALDLARDSDRPREYWLFYPGYRATQVNAIARIVSTAFDAY
jgi:hypothetical protein